MLLKIALLVTAIIQAISPLALYFDGFDRKTGQTPTPIVPATYAFSIWGVIYGLSLLYSGSLLLAAQPDPLLGLIGWPAAALFALATIWLVFARFGLLWATLPTIVAMLALAAWIVVTIGAGQAWLGKYGQWLTLGLFGLYAGWLTVATFANFMELAAASKFGFFGMSLQSWTLAALAGALLVACGVDLAAGGSWSYAAAVSWALVAIAVANVTRETRPAIVTACAVGVAVVLLTTWQAAERGSRAQSAAPARAA